MPPLEESSQSTNQNQTGRFFTSEDGQTVYADCHGLNRKVYLQRQKPVEFWGTVRQDDYEEFGSDEEEIDGFGGDGHSYNQSDGEAVDIDFNPTNEEDLKEV